MPEGAWDILGDVSKSLYRNPVGTERVGGEQSLTMPDADVSPVVGAFGAHPITQATNERAHDIANTLAGMDAAPGVGSIKAFHGSPHSFERFDPAKIGTGEGAQAYGHGLYFAEHEDIAKGYRDRLSGPSWTGRWLEVDGEHLHDNWKNGTEKSVAAKVLINHGNDKAAALADIDHIIEGAKQKAAEVGDNSYVEQWNRTRDHVVSFKGPVREVEPPKGSMYEVALHADPEHMLDWDKPLSEQHPKVREAMRQLHSEDPEAWERIESRAGTIKGSDLHDSAGLGQENQARRLREAGIPGIRYLDAGSRAKGEGTRNYVVFDPDLIEILRRYGIAGIAGAGGAAHALDWAPVGHDDKPGRPPAEAIEHLLEGHGTTFSNGQTWTLKDGRPERVDDADADVQ